MVQESSFIEDKAIHLNLQIQKMVKSLKVVMKKEKLGIANLAPCLQVLKNAEPILVGSIFNHSKKFMNFLIS
jgi:hypothetical protein